MPVNKYDAELISKLGANNAAVVTTVKEQRLRKMLDNSEFTSRKLSTLATTIGETEYATSAILKRIGARQLRNRRTGAILFSL